MQDALLIHLLQLQFRHEQKMREFGTKLDFSYFDIDLVKPVLDAIGLPRDNTVDQNEKHGYPAYVDHPDTFCRDYWSGAFYDMVENGTPDECAAYISWVRKEYSKYLAEK